MTEKRHQARPEHAPTGAGMGAPHASYTKTIKASFGSFRKAGNVIQVTD